MTKKILLAIALLLLSSNAYATNWCEDTNTVGCWNIEEGSGTNVEDKSQNTYDGTLGLSGTSWSSDTPSTLDGFKGTSSYSIKGDGSTDASCSTAYYPSGSVNAFAFWMKYSSGGSGYHEAIGTHDNNDHRFYLGATTDDGKYYYGYGSAYSDTISIDTDEASWNHYSIIYDGTNAELYINGVYKTEIASSFTGTSSISLNILRRDTGGIDDYLLGNMDEVIISESLDSTDINDIMDNGLMPQHIPTMMECRGSTFRGVTIY